MSLRSLFFATALVCAHAPSTQPTRVRTGLDVVLTDSIGVLRGKRVGLITNHTGIDASRHRNIDLLFRAAGVKLVALFGPEHGIGGTVRGGDLIGAAKDSATGLPVFSLYGQTRVPTPEMLRDVEVLVYDIQDVGARTYTYVWTMALAAEAAEKAGIPFVVLDRPNPIRADRVSGGVLDSAFRSFVGQYDVALRYGLTPGELLRFLVGTGRVHAHVTVVPMQGYRRSMWFSETGQPWVNPSPNIRDEETELLYPGTVLFEATNLSEGRGTDAPLKQVGAPWLTDADAIAQRLNAMRFPGLRFDSRRAPVSQGEKHGGQTIPFIRYVVTRPDSADAVTAGVWMLRVVRERHPQDFKWQRGNGIEQLSGDAALRRVVEGGGVEELLARWNREAAAFQQSTRPYWLY